MLIVALIVSCDAPQESMVDIVDPLPSWNEGVAKMSIIHFIDGAINPENEHYIMPADRIAVFDNDGTLWSEQPAYFQLFFAMDRIRTLAIDHPEWQHEQPFKAVLEGNMNDLMAQGEHGLLQLVLASHAGYTPEQFEKEVKDWLAAAEHPRFKMHYTELVYQPMIELINLLKKSNFKVFIVSGGGIEFMRPWVEEAYGIPRENVIGSSLKMVYDEGEEGPKLLSIPEIDHINDKSGKVVGIQRHIGRRPVFVGGNSDGDLQMMQWSDSQDGQQFVLTIHHTDSVREWAYDKNSSIGRLDKGLEESAAKNWTLVDMRNDWKVIYPFELKN